jgi:hypothetical protein
VFTYVYLRYASCLLLQILFVAALDIKTRDVPTVSSVNSLLSQYCKATVRFAAVVPWAKAGPGRHERITAIPHLGGKTDVRCQIHIPVDVNHVKNSQCTSRRQAGWIPRPVWTV